MFIALSLVLITLLKGVLGRNAQDIEVVLLPLWNTEDALEVPLAFKVFGDSIQLTLYRNDRILSSQFEIWKHDAEGLVELSEISKSVSCHYLHRNRTTSAAISLCGKRGVRGFVFLENVTLEITPIEDEDSLFFNDHNVKRSGDLGEPHVVKRSYVSPVSKYGQNNWQEYDRSANLPLTVDDEFLSRLAGERASEALQLELAVFFDEVGYQLFSPFLDRDDEKIRDMLLAYINGVQALYHHPSLGPKIDITLVRLDLIQKQPTDLPHFDGERGSLLDSFCNYARRYNPPDDLHPKHWDMALYVSGLDFYAYEGGRKNSGTMGLATVGGVCINEYSCVIAELGVTNHFGKPYPSAGFTSVYIAAHEIGHNLGMHHDSIGNSCPKDGYIMSPSRGTQGETIWSECSRDVAQRLSWTKLCLLDKPVHQIDRSLDHARFLNLPGREWTGKRQCEVLLRDRDATVVTLYRACESLQCASPHRSGYYFAGPALEGTYCAPRRECRGGQCLPALEIPTKPGGSFEMQEGGWSEWKEGACSSGCLQRSKGARTRRRYCNNPTPKNTDTGCEGFNYDVILCRDDKLCKKKRRTIKEFAALRCVEFAERLPELDGKGGGLQAPHESERPWMACAIFCRRKDIASYYTPRVELNDLGLDPYFPDGTWCHAEEGQDYFCRRHHCLPEDFRFGKRVLKGDELDLDLGPQNARPDERKLDNRLIKYLSIGPDGLPFLTSLSHGMDPSPGEDEWTDKDYVELKEPVVDSDVELQFLEEPARL